MSARDLSELEGGWEAAAAEYALGLLDDEERRAFEAQMARDPDLRQDVAVWSEYFATLTDTLADTVPPERLKRRIEAELFGAGRTSWFGQLWPYLAGAVAAAGIAWAVVFTGLLTPATAPLTATLEPVESEIALSAVFEPDTGTLRVDRTAGDVPSDRVLELWLIAEGAPAPVSLGLLGEGGTVLALPPLLAEQMAGATLAVSEEPPGGSTTGAPSGPVRAAGQLG